jgi:hypothetical protein
MTNVDPDAVYDEFFEPLSLALGHLVFGAAMLEKAMLADLIQRRVIRDGPEEVFGKQIVSRLERKSAGALLPELRELGYEGLLADEIASAIQGRNHFVHHLFEDPEFIKVFAGREGLGRLAARVETVVSDIYGVVKKLEPEVASGMEAVFQRSAPELLELVKEIDPDEFGDGEERRQLEAIQELPDEFMEE